MTYEEKLEVFKRDGQIPTSWIEPPDFFRFLRDGMTHKVTYRDCIYEPQCTHVTEWPYKAEIYEADDCQEYNDFNTFMRESIESGDEGKYFYVDDEMYLFKLDILESP